MKCQSGGGQTLLGRLKFKQAQTQKYKGSKKDLRIWDIWDVTKFSCKMPVDVFILLA